MKFLHQILSFVIIMALAGCSSTRTYGPKKATSRPYEIKGVTYKPQRHFEYSETGFASYYGIRDGFQGKPTASGEIFNTNDLTAAHKTLPLPCSVKVTNLKNGKALVLRVNDRGPFVSGRIIDVSERAAKLLGFYHDGVAKVRVETLVEQSLAMQKKSKKRIAPSKTYQRNLPMVKPSKVIHKLPLQEYLRSGVHVKYKPKRKIQDSYYRPASRSVQPQHRPRYAQESRQISAPQELSRNARKSYFVQAVSFSTRERAVRHARYLNSLKYKAKIFIKPFDVQSTKMYAVRMGPIARGLEAEDIVQQLIDTGYEHAIRMHY